MDKVGEKEMLSMLSGKRVLLLEPNEGTYIPLGLAKIATFVKRGGGEVEFSKSVSSSKGEHDLIAMSTLFTYDSGKYRDVLSRAGAFSSAPILVGGVCASLAHGLLDPKDTNEPRPISLSGAPQALAFQGFSPELDQCVPDYSIDWGNRDGWEKYSYVFTSRGCPNNCAYCAVPRLEKTAGGILVTPNWREHIVEDRQTCVVLDNNLTAAPGKHMEEVLLFLADKKKTVIGENGVDCKHVTPEAAELLGKVKWAGNGLRIAFDRIEEDGVFQGAIRLLLGHGVHPRKIMSYVLYNFNDTPKDAEYRLLECARLGVQPYPQRFVPLGQSSRDNIYVGKHWTKRLGIAFAHYGIMGKFRVKGSLTDFVAFGEFVRRPDMRKKFNLSDDDLSRL